MDKSGRNRLVGGFGGAGLGLIFFALFMYFIASSTIHGIIEPTLLIGSLGVSLLLVAIVISFLKIPSKKNQV